MGQPITPYPITRIHQVSFVVRDLETAMQAFWEQFRIGPWAVFTFNGATVQEMTYRGRRQDYAMTVAFAQKGDVQLELIQSLEGPNIYEDFLAQQPAGGQHHIGLTVPNLDEGIAAMEAAGWTMIQSGRGTGVQGDGGFAYFEAAGPLPLLLEIIEIPRERKAPDRFFPADARPA